MTDAPGHGGAPMGPRERAGFWWPLQGPPALRPLPRRILLALVVLLVVGLGANAVRRAKKGATSRYDESTGWASELVWQHVNVYERHPSEGTHAKYPPCFFVLMSPLSPLPVVVGAGLWYLLNVGLGVLAVILAVRAFRAEDHPPPLGQVLLVGALVSWMVGTNLETSQVNVLILCLVTGGLFLFLRGRERAGGVLLGLSIALKLTPALFVVVLLWKREWRAVEGTVLGVLLGAVLLPCLALGPAFAWEATRSWAGVIAGFAKLGALGEGIGGFRPTNQSLSAAFHRFFVDLGAAGAPYRRVNVASLSFEEARTVVRVLSLALVLGLLASTRGREKDRRSLSWPLDLGMTAVVALMVSPISWTNHYVVLLLPYAAAVEALRRMADDDARRSRVVRLLVAATALLLLGSIPLLMAFSLPFAGALVLLGTLGWLRKGSPRRASPTAS